MLIKGLKKKINYSSPELKKKKMFFPFPPPFFFLSLSSPPPFPPFPLFPFCSLLFLYFFFFRNFFIFFCLSSDYQHLFSWYASKNYWLCFWNFIKTLLIKAKETIERIERNEIFTQKFFFINFIFFFFFIRRKKYVTERNFPGIEVGRK